MRNKGTFQKLVKHTTANGGNSGLAGCKFLSACENKLGKNPIYTCDWSSQSQFSSHEDEVIKKPCKIWDKKSMEFKSLFTNGVISVKCSICDKKIDSFSDEFRCQALFENPKIKFN